jgi:ribosome-binding protein aMBF1 (putative translation factor)
MADSDSRGVAAKARPAAKAPAKLKSAAHRKVVLAVKTTKKVPQQRLVVAPASEQQAKVAARFFDSDGKVAIKRVAEDFGMSKGQLAATVGLHPEALYKASRTHAPKTQNRVREMLEIVSRISDWAGGKDQAMAWYRAEPIPAFGGRTAESIVKTGQAGVLRDYLDALAMGGFA